MQFNQMMNLGTCVFSLQEISSMAVALELKSGPTNTLQTWSTRISSRQHISKQSIKTKPNLLNVITHHIYNLGPGMLTTTSQELDTWVGKWTNVLNIDRRRSGHTFDWKDPQSILPRWNGKHIQRPSGDTEIRWDIDCRMGWHQQGCWMCLPFHRGLDVSKVYDCISWEEIWSPQLGDAEFGEGR